MTRGSFPSEESGGPLQELARLHAQTLGECAKLRQLALDLPGDGGGDASRRAAQSLLRHFDLGAPQYRLCEEQQLFPQLLESMAGSDPVCLRDLTSAMSAQHRRLDSMWRALRGPLAALAAGQPASLASAQVEEFVALSQSHIERERDEVLPMASRLLTDEALAQIGDAMRARRAISCA